MPHGCHEKACNGRCKCHQMRGNQGEEESPMSWRSRSVPTRLAASCASSSSSVWQSARSTSSSTPRLAARSMPVYDARCRPWLCLLPRCWGLLAEEWKLAGPGPKASAWLRSGWLSEPLWGMLNPGSCLQHHQIAMIVPFWNFQRIMAAACRSTTLLLDASTQLLGSPGHP